MRIAEPCSPPAPTRPGRLRNFRRVLAALAFGLPLLTASAARASETITYSHDARGRIKTVAHSGTVNNGKTTTYGHDKTDNRLSKSTTP
jgi:hypothetical protein